MDPDVAYTIVKEWAEKDAEENPGGAGESFLGLDGWLKMGGHAPKAWDQRLRSR